MKTVALDFDGVMNTYDGWRGEDVLFEPREGLADFLALLSTRYEIVIYTTREPHPVWDWLRQYGLEDFIADVTNGEKPKAVAYVDDRAVRFNGDYNEVLAVIEQPTHWEDPGE